MTITSNEYTLIIDIGKTHVKVHLLDSATFESVFAKQMSNQVNKIGIYPSMDIEAIWIWCCDSIAEAAALFKITKLTVTTHGATAALIDRNRSDYGGLVLPVLDYEYSDVQLQTPNYEECRPDFSSTYSPMLPAGLNLGRQLFWLKQEFPKGFEQATDILMYPQYWVWRFTGQLFSEITSLGCHTDLWSLEKGDYSSLVEQLDCRDKFPELKPAWYAAGVVKSELTSKLGLESNCQVYSGLHDSNASYLRYRLSQGNKPFTVVSTGTWTILMASQIELENLNPSKDMLANIDALGTPIACARFMGGREFEAICEQAGSWLGEQFELQDLQNVIDNKVFAIPDFSGGSGPFGGQKSSFNGDVNKVSGIALATIYCALMTDYQLDMLGAKGDVYIEGAFLKNPLLCSIVSQLRTEQLVKLSLDTTGTVQGAAYLTDWENIQGQIEAKSVQKSELTNLLVYKNMWRKLIEG
ncbi:FGGY family carbohydrate kinase [Psychrosphaera sp. 1_MG-2023]|uniref:FGGY-family carbohydrate kinase n=1 Tax=Psychrosphaera sp. 1_MG-2023 TaxID=3062643 RepID=UPI0026E1E5EE|nr:FGGY family carbohydrate kinase [Psychrosphaera sp. 1_MG-2023]MDO6719809.1 FGGY family carbohydrate kinase [Psychrosphaera sp. 1_MG-2023]